MSGGSKQFPLNPMRRRQSGSMGQGMTQIQINGANDRQSNITSNFQEEEKQGRQPVGRSNATGGGAKPLFAGQNKIKLNSSGINS